MLGCEAQVPFLDFGGIPTWYYCLTDPLTMAVAAKRTLLQRRQAAVMQGNKLGAQKMAKDDEELAVLSLIETLRKRPRLVNHLERNINIGAFDWLDYGEEGGDDTDSAKLRDACNKVCILDSKDWICGSIVEHWPGEYFSKMSTFKKVKKDRWLSIFEYIYNIDRSSALPTKNIAQLNSFFKSQFDKFAARRAAFDPAGQPQDNDFEDRLGIHIYISH